jgi:hypothetical protein
MGLFPKMSYKCSGKIPLKDRSGKSRFLNIAAGN